MAVVLEIVEGAASQHDVCQDVTTEAVEHGAQPGGHWAPAGNLHRACNTEEATLSKHTHGNAPSSPNKDGGFIRKEEKDYWKQILPIFEYYGHAKAVHCTKLVCEIKLLTSVVQIFYCQEFDWMFNLCEIQQRKAVNNDLQESLSACPLCCVFIRTHLPIPVHTLRIRLVFHKQMLTQDFWQDFCSSDRSVWNYIHSVLVWECWFFFKKFWCIYVGHKYDSVIVEIYIADLQNIKTNR